MYLHYIYRYFSQKEGQTKLVNIYKRTLLSIFILNPILRFLKLFRLSMAQVGKKERCTWLNAYFSIYHTINATLFLVITIYYRKLPYEDDTLDKCHVALVVLEFFCIFIGLLTNYSDFSDEPNCDFYCGCCDKDTEKQTIKEKKEEKKKKSKYLEKKIKENKDYDLEIDKNEEALENILFEIKKINAEKEEMKYKLYLDLEHKKECEIYQNLPNKSKKLESILEKRLQELLKLKELYDKNKSKSNKFSYYKKNKLKTKLYIF